MAIKKIPRKNVSDTVFEKLRREIINGVFKEGDKLPSAARLGGQFGVSIATIKLALNRLKVLGLIETRNGTGSFVLSFNPYHYLNQVTDFLRSESDISGVSEFRLCIEPVIAELAMRNAREENFRAMETLLRQMDEAAQKKNSKLRGSLDYQFHLEIAKATQNIMFILTYELIGQICHQHAVMLNDLHSGTVEGARAEKDVHWKLYRAIKAGNITACRKCYKEMLG